MGIENNNNNQFFRHFPEPITAECTWEFLPPGQRPPTLKPKSLVKRLLGSKAGKAGCPVPSGKIPERKAFLDRLGPKKWIYGVSKDRRYMAAQFGPNFMVFENMDYGNGLYAIQGDWEALSKLPRLELRKRLGVTHIIHSRGWEKRVLALINRHRSEPPEPGAMALAA